MQCVKLTKMFGIPLIATFSLDLGGTGAGYLTIVQADEQFENGFTPDKSLGDIRFRRNIASNGSLGNRQPSEHEGVDCAEHVAVYSEATRVPGYERYFVRVPRS